MLQFDVCCKAIDQNFDCGCDRCAILHLDSLIHTPVTFAASRSLAKQRDVNVACWCIVTAVIQARLVPR